MASFERSFSATLGHEQGWVDDPVDRGGETYKGIARKRHPDWIGWAQIDQVRDDPSFPRCLRRSQSLNILVEEFYREHFWTPIQGTRIPVQALADELFDTGVNMGTPRAVSFLQDSLNVLNRDAKVYPDLHPDGVLGERTFEALEIFLRYDHWTLLLKLLNILQGARYIELAEAQPDQERFLRGWMKRVMVEKTGGITQPV